MPPEPSFLESRYSVKKCAWIIALSVLLSLSLFFFGYRLYQTISGKEPTSNVVQILLQTTPKGTRLPTACLAEWLELSVDHPTPMSSLHCKELCQRLEAQPLIASAYVKKLKTHTLFIEYLLREPLLFLEDSTHTALDAEGRLFPFTPFYPPSLLPTLYLGREPRSSQISKHHMEIVQTFLKTFGASRLARIDLSHLVTDSLGSQEIVVCFRNGPLVRFSPDNYLHQLSRYLSLEDYLLQQKLTARLVDMRLSDVAYLTLSHE